MQKYTLVTTQLTGRSTENEANTRVKRLIDTECGYSPETAGQLSFEFEFGMPRTPRTGLAADTHSNELG